MRVAAQLVFDVYIFCPLPTSITWSAPHKQSDDGVSWLHLDCIEHRDLL